MRERELAFGRELQYLKEASGDEVSFGYSLGLREGRMTGVITWSRIFYGMGIICAINSDVDVERSV
jgi:hypothetical protein